VASSDLSDSDSQLSSKGDDDFAVVLAVLVGAVGVVGVAGVVAAAPTSEQPNGHDVTSWNQPAGMNNESPSSRSNTRAFGASLATNEMDKWGDGVRVWLPSVRARAECKLESPLPPLPTRGYSWCEC
jgi:hypothetical protein